jgi:glutamate dehydrogenase (NAD(P)+)
VQEQPYLQLTWQDRDTGRRGYLVIDRLVRGVASGGLRMRSGCTLDEVRELAAGMTAKEALSYDPASQYIPLGGAKGGIDCDPQDPRASQVLRRYLEAVRPYIEHVWTMGEDLGLRQDAIDEALEELGVESSIMAAYPLLDDPAKARRRLSDAFAVTVDGVALDELVGGYGVAEAALAGLEQLGLEPEGSRAFVQGFGSMGGATARYLARAGVRVVGIADAVGVVANPAGLDVENLLLTRNSFGEVDRAELRYGDAQLPLRRWLDVEAEILVPAAVSYAITAGNQASVNAKLIAEAANMPVTAEAEGPLTERGVLILPDIVANSATNAWWWWTLYGDVEPNAESSFAKISSSVRESAASVLHRASLASITPRAAAAALAAESFRTIERTFPTA